MNILFYVEPHPTRGNDQAFTHVAKSFFPLLTNTIDDIESKMYVNKLTLSKVSLETVTRYQPHIIFANADEENFFESLKTEANDNGINTWLDLIEGRGISSKYLKILERLYLFFRFDVIVHWGENGAINQFSSKYGVAHVALELGCSRKPFFDSLAIDLQGTNGSALVPKLSIDEIKKSVCHRSMSSDMALALYSDQIPSNAYLDSFEPLENSIHQRLLNCHKSAFFPLQLYDDINLLKFSNLKTLEEVVLSTVPKLIEAGYVVVIKTHPLSKRRNFGLLENRIAKAALLKFYENIVWIEDESGNVKNSQLIQATDFTITVNSSIGFEATYFNKPVVVLGEAIYKPRNLFPTLEQVIAGKFNLQLYEKNLGYLREFMLGAYLQNINILKNPFHFYSLIRLLLDAKNNSNNDYQKLANNIYVALCNQNRKNAVKKSLISQSPPENFQPTKDINKENTIRNEITKKIFLDKMLFAAVTKTTNNNSNNKHPAFSENFFSDEMLATLIHESGIVDVNFYLEKYKDVFLSGFDPSLHYSRHGISESRNPRPGITFSSKNDLTKELVKNADIQTLNTIRKIQKIEAINYIAISNQIKRTNKIYCIVLEIFYKNLFAELIESLTSIKDDVDLIVVVPDWGNKEIKNIALEKFPNAIFTISNNEIFPNKSIKSLAEQLNRSSYSAILHLNQNSIFENEWSISKIENLSGQLLESLNLLKNQLKTTSPILSNENSELVAQSMFNPFIYRDSFTDENLEKNLHHFFNIFWVETSEFAKNVDLFL